MKKIFNTKIKNQNNRAFTLIELLVVVAIIGILSSVVLASLNSARAKARDARRISDLRQINNAILMYFNNKGSYPVCGTEQIDNGSTECLPLVLKNEGLLNSFPVDPKEGKDGILSWGGDYEYSSNGIDYALRIGFEGTPLKQNSDYPSGICDSGIYRTCGWYENCVYYGYSKIGCSGMSLQYGSR